MGGSGGRKWERREDINSISAFLLSFVCAFVPALKISSFSYEPRSQIEGVALCLKVYPVISRLLGSAPGAKRRIDLSEDPPTTTTAARGLQEPTVPALVA